MKLDLDELRQSDLDAAVCRIYDGTTSTDDVVLLRMFNQNPDLDPRDVWIEAGLTHLREAGLTVLGASAADDTPHFAVRTWAQELQRAFALGIADESTAVFPGLRSRRVRTYLTNLGHVTEARANPPTKNERMRDRNAWERRLRHSEWVRRQRARFQRGAMTKDQQLALEALEVRLTPETAALRWERGLTLLAQFVEKHGAVPIRPGHREHLNEWFSMNLEAWLRHQREHAQAGALREERVTQLEAAGFPWSITAARPHPKPASPTVDR